MKNVSFQIQKIQDLGFLEKGGVALDIGCGEGKDTLPLLESGFIVDAVDVNHVSLKNLHQKAEGLPVTTHEQPVSEFIFSPNKYDVVVASNVLPFLSDKKEVFEIFHKIIESVKKGGHIYVTFFGPADEWSGNPEMSFFTFEEINNLIESVGLIFKYRSTEEGLGKMMNGNMKYWHIHRYLLEK